jgi:hypothetical protein
MRSHPVCSAVQLVAGCLWAGMMSCANSTDPSGVVHDGADAGAHVASRGEGMDAGALVEATLPSTFDDACGNDWEVVDKSLLVGTVPQCQAGSAHPSVCCLGAPHETAVCVESVDHPFRPCGCGMLTFPDPRTCCSLSSGGDCRPPDAQGSDGGPWCQYPCGPGAFLPPSGTNTPACSDVPNLLDDAGLLYQAESCFYCCTDSSCLANASTCLANEQCPAHFTICGACPEGWSSPPGNGTVCCQGPSGPAQKCYSQVTHIVPGGT